MEIVRYLAEESVCAKSGLLLLCHRTSIFRPSDFPFWSRSALGDFACVVLVLPKVFFFEVLDSAGSGSDSGTAIFSNYGECNFPCFTIW